MLSRRQMLAGMAGTAALSAAACSSSSKKTTTSSAAPDKVVYLTGFGQTPRECVAWVAAGKGYFTDVNIQATIQPGQPSDANLKLVTTGKAQFALVDFVSAIRGALTYPNVRSIAAIQHSTLLSLMALPKSGITRPIDLQGKTLGAATAAATQTLFPTYARLAKVDNATIKWKNAPSDQLPALLASGAIDAMGTYSVDTPGVSAAAGGVEPVVLRYSDYISDLYGSVLVTTTDLIQKNPDMVQRFAGALIKGVNYAVNNPDDAGNIFSKAVTGAAKPAVTSKTLAQMKPYVTTAALDSERVMRGIALLEAGGLAQAGLTPAQVIDANMTAKISS